MNRNKYHSNKSLQGLAAVGRLVKGLAMSLTIRVRFPDAARTFLFAATSKPAHGTHPLS